MSHQNNKKTLIMKHRKLIASVATSIVAIATVSYLYSWNDKAFPQEISTENSSDQSTDIMQVFGTMTMKEAAEYYVANAPSNSNVEDVYISKVLPLAANGNYKQEKEILAILGETKAAEILKPIVKSDQQILLNEMDHNSQEFKKIYDEQIHPALEIAITDKLAEDMDSLMYQLTRDVADKILEEIAQSPNFIAMKKMQLSNTPAALKDILSITYRNAKENLLIDTVRVFYLYDQRFSNEYYTSILNQSIESYLVEINNFQIDLCQKVTSENLDIKTSCRSLEKINLRLPDKQRKLLIDYIVSKNNDLLTNLVLEGVGTFFPKFGFAKMGYDLIYGYLGQPEQKDKDEINKIKLECVKVLKEQTMSALTKHKEMDIEPYLEEINNEIKNRLI